MDSSTFDSISRALAATRSRRRLTWLGALSLLGLPAMDWLAEGGAAKQGGKGKRKRKKRRGRRRRCRPEARSVTCAGAHCAEARTNRCGEEVSCGCPSGFNCLLSGTCARACGGSHGSCEECGANAFCTAANTEGQQHCVVESLCAEHQVCSTSTSECPRGTQCQPCGINEPNRCIPVAACAGA